MVPAVIPVEFIAYGKPEPKGSAQGFAMPVVDKATRRPVYDRKGRPRYRAIITTDNPKSKEWERTIRQAATAAAGGRFFNGPVEVRITFGLLRPPSVPVKKRPYPTTKPDVDKLVRAVFDGISQVLFRDDAQVVQVTARKRYVEYGASYAKVWVGEVDASTTEA